MSRGQPKREFSWIVQVWIQACWAQYVIVPLQLTSPDMRIVSPIIANRRELFPEPTLPMTAVKGPRLIATFTLQRKGSGPGASSDSSSYATFSSNGDRVTVDVYNTGVGVTVEGLHQQEETREYGPMTSLQQQRY